MQYFAFELNGFPALLLLLGLLYMVVFLPIKLMTKALAHAKLKTDKIRLLHANTIVAEYAAPQGLQPAELGQLYDSKTGIEEVYATILSLAQQSLLALEQKPDGLSITGVNAASVQLEPFETYVLQRLTAVNNQIVTTKMLNDFSARHGMLVNEALIAKGYRANTATVLKGFGVRVVGTGLGLMLLTALAFHPSTANGTSTLIFFLVFFTPGYFLFAAVLYYIFQKISGQPWTATAKLKQLWPDIEGYRQYIQEVELDTLRFESNDIKQQAKDGTLPYAVALGLNTGWRNQIN